LWAERWRPAVKETNQPLPFEILAPWPAEQSFEAGGLSKFIVEQAAVLDAGFLAGALLALSLSTDDCGFGVRGYYYNTDSTHSGANAFAIDFTRYKQFEPYQNAAGGTPVLAARAGIVASPVYSGTPNGSTASSNKVNILHADPADPAVLDRFTSRYLHLEGPCKINVSAMMAVVAGNRLGTMDDTGDSLMDHLHFSIHDQKIPFPGSEFGGSVRPTPMSGVTLEDGDSGTCVWSTNVEVGEKQMIEASNFAGQNWLITPAASAVNEAPPAKIKDQKWLLVLSGVAIVDLEGNSGLQWRRETVSIRPNLNGPLQYAIGKYGVPTPPATSGYLTEFQVEQWAPFAALSSVYNEGQSVNSGFAVDVWRPNPFGTGQDALSNAALDNLFAGIQVDVAVRDSDAWIYRLSYNITLLGKIVFRPLLLT
jgi:hypothetical protein